MTDEQLGAMTLADIEALAKRLNQAVSVLRDAQGFLGAANQPLAASAPKPPPTPGPSDLTASERAERDRLLKQFRDEDLPDNIKQAERS